MNRDTGDAPRTPPPTSEESNLFTALEPDDKRFLLEHGTREVFEPGAVIIHEGDRDDSFYLLVRGELEVTTEREGELVSLATLTKGAVFGEVPALSHTPRTATVTALEQVAVVRFEKSTLDELMVTNPDLRELLIELVFDRAKATIEKIFGDGSL